MEQNILPSFNMGKRFSFERIKLGTRNKLIRTRSLMEYMVKKKFSAPDPPKAQKKTQIVFPSFNMAKDNF
jgi:hypothetical protein